MTPITMNPQDPIGDRPTMEPQQPTRRGRRRVLLIGILALVLVVLAGGYVAATRGYIALPFITPSKDELFAKMIASLSSIENAQYTLRTDIGVEDRQGGAETLFPNTNASDDTGYSGDAFLDTVNGITGSNDIFRSIPLDMGVQTAVTFYFEADAEPRKADARLAIDGTYHGGDLDAAFDLEARKRGQDFYATVRKFPSLPIFDLSALKGKWIAATPDDPVGSALLDGLENVKIREQVDRLKDMLGDALEQEVFTVERRLPAETIAGVNTLQYRIALHPENLAAVYRARIEEKTAKGESAYSLETALKSLEKPETMERLNRLARQSTVTVWIERATGLLRQIRWHLAVVPPDSSERMAGKQFAVTMTLTLEHVNENISVDTPGETIDYDEAERLLTGITLDEQQLQKQYDRISGIRSVLSYIKQYRGAFPDAITDLESELRAIADECAHAPVNANTSSTKAASCGSASYYRTKTVNATDVYTGKPYAYQLDGDDFQLVYDIRLSEDASQSYIASYVVDGKNTATSTDSSLEKQSPYENDEPFSGNTDDDGDGLKNSNERMLGTSTTKKDTDGDSFDDKTEYFNGYNPNGAGASTTGAWSACTNLSTLSGDQKTCAAYCTSVGKRCTDSAITTDDTYGYGAETWNSGDDCSAKNGATKYNSCSFESASTDARWKCFCR